MKRIISTIIIGVVAMGATGAGVFFGLKTWWPRSDTSQVTTPHVKILGFTDEAQITTQTMLTLPQPANATETAEEDKAVRKRTFTTTDGLRLSLMNVNSGDTGKEFATMTMQLDYLVHAVADLTLKPMSIDKKVTTKVGGTVDIPVSDTLRMTFQSVTYTYQRQDGHYTGYYLIRAGGDRSLMVAFVRKTDGWSQEAIDALVAQLRIVDQGVAPAATSAVPAATRQLQQDDQAAFTAETFLSPTVSGVTLGQPVDGVRKATLPQGRELSVHNTNAASTYEHQDTASSQTAYFLGYIQRRVIGPLASDATKIEVTQQAAVQPVTTGGVGMEFQRVSYTYPTKQGKQTAQVAVRIGSKRAVWLILTGPTNTWSSSEADALLTSLRIERYGA